MRSSKIAIQYPEEKLTPREVEILSLIACGNTRQDVAYLLSISGHTVKEHLTRACNKLGAVNKTHAVTRVMALGLIAPYQVPASYACMACGNVRVPQMGDEQNDPKLVMKKTKL